jgi:hypothetical protein
MTYANYQSGWCGSCGRKRGKDGRCENCDPWWSSPLVTYGAPLVVGLTVLLTVGASIARNNQGRNFGTRTVSVPQTAPRTYAPLKTNFSPGGFASAPASAYGTSASSPAPMRGSFGGAIPVLNILPADANRPTRAQIQAADHEQLRQTTAYVDNTLRADDIAREYSQRNAHVSSTSNARSMVATASERSASF